MTSVNDVITKIAYKIGAMVKESDNQANQTVSSATKSTKTDTSAKAPTSNKTEDKKPSKKPSKKTKFNDDIKRGVQQLYGFLALNLDGETTQIERNV